MLPKCGTQADVASEGAVPTWRRRQGGDIPHDPRCVSHLLRTATRGSREADTGSKGNPVSSKPANQGVLASQRKRLEHERKLADLASRPPSGSSSRYTPLLLIFLFLPLLSSFLTGTSYTFHLAPHVVPPVSKWWRLSSINPNRSTLRTFTPHQLSRYDGKREDRPLYIALAGDVYDVSANRRIYGPGGSYSMM